jgi:hypothetical protein
LTSKRNPPRTRAARNGPGDRQDRKGPKPIRDAIRKFLRESSFNRPAEHERVFRAWSEAAGTDWQKRAVPVSFRGGQLTVEVSSSVHLAELRNFSGETLRARANAALGRGLIRKLTFKLRG